MSAVATVAPGALLDGQYEVLGVLGEGGMATVYKVRHLQQGTLFAAKVLAPTLVADPGVKERFLQEGRIQQGIHHPNIVRVMGSVADPLPGLVMELVEGGHLGSLGRWADAGLLVATFRQVLAGVAAAHARGLVHRDLKPENILLHRGADGRVTPKVADFGIARGPQSRLVTNHGVTMGTANYMSPEQVRGNEVVDARSDIFALGAVLYELVTGKMAFAGTSQYEVWKAIEQGRYVPPEQLVPGLDVALAACIHRALAPSPEDRFPNCVAFSNALPDLPVKAGAAPPAAAHAAAAGPGTGSPRPASRPPTARPPTQPPAQRLVTAPPQPPPWAPGPDHVTDPRRVFGHFEILAPLGRGGMAEVYRALELEGPRKGQVVALKRLLPAFASNPDYVDLFTSEADLGRMLVHPNIVRTYEVGQVRDTYYICMEFVDGRDVGAVLKQCRERNVALPTAYALYFVKMLLEALDFAHTLRSPSGRPLGLVHSDVSPSNLFIARYGEVKLGDFGVARAGEASAVGEAAVSGKPHYLPPEAEQGELTQAADLWAANVVLYELLTQKRPFDGETPKDVMKAVRGGRWLPVRLPRPDVPPGVAELVQRGFEKDPAHRFPSARAFADALAPLYGEQEASPLAIASLLRMLFGPNLGY